MKYMFDAYISVMKAARDAIMSFNIIAWKIYSYLPSVMAWKVQSVISFWLLEQNDNHLETGITSVADKSHPCMTLMDALDDVLCLQTESAWPCFGFECSKLP